MTQDLHDRLDQLVADVPAYVIPDARAAWVAGARRRTRLRIGVVVAAAIVVAMAGTAVAWLPRTLQPAPGGSNRGAGVSEYPSRIDYPYWSPELDGEPGPLAGFVGRVRHEGTSDQSLGWYGVAQNGRLWELPSVDDSYWPALSPDGLQLGYPVKSKVAKVLDFDIVHLADGSVSSISVGMSGFSGSPDQFPSFWSPDSRHVVVFGGLRQGRAVVMGVDGRINRVRTDLEAWPAGWVDPTTIAWLRIDSRRAATVVMTDVAGQATRSVSIELPSAYEYAGQWSGSVSADGSRIAVASRSAAGAEIQVYSLATGEQVGAPVRVEMDGPCLPSWAGNDVRVPVSGADVILSDAEDRPVVVGDSRLQSRCSQWASEALSGSADDGLVGWVFGSSNSWLSWHWREVGLGIAVGPALLLALLVVRRRRQRLEPTS